MKLAIVILNWNGKHLLEQFIPSVILYSPEADIYIADNASTDDSVAFISQQYPKVKMIQNTSNRGYAGGYNEALQHIRAEVYCLLNSDIEVSPQWLQPVVNLFKADEQIAVIQPKILAYHQKNHFEYAGAAGGYIDALGYPFCRGRIFNTIEEDHGQYDDIKEIFWASGACFFIRSSIFHEHHGFDENYFAHQEEIDLCWRIRHSGLKILYTGSSTVYHVGGATLNNTSPEKTYLNYRNSLFSLSKNLPNKMLFGIIFTRLLLDGIAGIRFFFQGKLRHVIAIIKAHISFYKKLRKMLKKRKSSLSYQNYYYTRSIVWSYFINKKRYFNSIPTSYHGSDSDKNAR